MCVCVCVCVCVYLLLSFYFLVLCCLTVTHNHNYHNRTQDLMPQHGKFISAQAIKAKTCTVTLKSSSWWPGYTPPPPPPHTHTHTHKYPPPPPPPPIDSLKLALPGRCADAIEGRQGSAGLCSYFSSVTEHSTPAVLKFGGNPACAVRVLSVCETISFRTLQLGVCAGSVHAGYSRACCGVRAFL